MTNLAVGAANAPVEFQFQTNTVRAVNRNGECWFVAADVGAVLTLGNIRSSIALLDDDEKGVHSMDTPSGKQEMSIINESGLYALILRSRKPEAKRFRKWVTSEVLPAIRKTGGYIHEAAMKPAINYSQYIQLQKEASDAVCGWLRMNALHISNHLRVIFSVRRVQDIPAEHFETARAIIQSKREAVRQFHAAMIEMKDWFEKEVLSGGMPWTPSIQRMLSRKLKRQVILPPKVDWLALAEKAKKPVNGKEGGAK